MKRISFLFTLFLIVMPLCARNITLKGKISDDKSEVIPFANIALFLASDTTVLIKGTASDLSGNYSLTDIPQGKYVINVSYIGYETESIPVYTGSADLVKNVILKSGRIELNEVVVAGNRSVRSIDKTTYTFTEKQLNKAQDSRELVSTLPNLHIDKASNAISAISGEPVLILINGIKATDEELKLISADKIWNVEYYDVPPIRYINDARTVINIRTKPLDTGWSGSFYTTAGQMFSNATAALSYIKGDNKFTFMCGTHLNMKRHVKNIETGLYEYQINESNYIYDYTRNSLTWGDQYNMNFTYSKSKAENYDFQVKAMAYIGNDKLDSDKKIFLSQGNTQEHVTGALTNRVHSVSPVLDIYYYKQFSKKSNLTFDLLGSYFKNEQLTHSIESGILGFDDLMSIDNQKKSIIGEVVYSHKLEKINMSAGYKGHFNFLTNKLSNTLSEGKSKEDINTQKHYFFGEMSGLFKSFMYRLSLGANYDTQLGSEGFRNITFTPMVMAGYRMNDKNSLRISYSSGTQMPDVQQMSDARILIMNNFYQSGNKNLINSHSQIWRLSYDYSVHKLSLQTGLFYEMTKHSLFDNYVYDENAILLQTGNAENDIRRGAELRLNYTPWDFLRIGCNVSANQHVFQPVKEVAAYHYWSYPVSLYLSGNYKNFSLSYFQKFGGMSLSGLYKRGIEKVSYISLDYRYKKFDFGLQCFFPFIKDKVVNETISGSIVYHKTNLHMKRKDHTFGVSVSWRFQSGKRKDAVEQNIQNSDDDKGLFNIK